MVAFVCFVSVGARFSKDFFFVCVLWIHTTTTTKLVALGGRCLHASSDYCFVLGVDVRSKWILLRFSLT